MSVAVGMMVAFHPKKSDKMCCPEGCDHLAGIIAGIVDETHVNLCVFEHSGLSCSRTNVLVCDKHDPGVETCEPLTEAGLKKEAKDAEKEAAKAHKEEAKHEAHPHKKSH